MGFSPKRLKAVAKGKVEYCIYDGINCVYRDKSFIKAVQMLDSMQKASPMVNYEMKIEEIK